MTSVQQHYDTQLGAIYEWMLGGRDAAAERARTDVRAARIAGGAGRVAVDLGAGPGTHAVALADAGYNVIAIDTCAALLEELRVHGGERPIRRVLDDLIGFRRHSGEPVEVIVCMNDTLTHLPSREAVERLFEDVAIALAPGGTFVATFRDYTTPAPQGAGRFIPVRQDDRRILVCFLEYDERTVRVTDLLHEWTGSGWTFRASSYSKLRLDPEWTRTACERLGLRATVDVAPAGMVRLMAVRPA